MRWRSPPWSAIKGSKFEGDNIYKVKFSYQVAAQLGDTTWAGWDSANPTLARWNGVKYADTYRVVLYDDQGSVVTQTVENATSYDFSQFMTRDRVNYYFEVMAIARNGDQRLSEGRRSGQFSGVRLQQSGNHGRHLGRLPAGPPFTKTDGTNPAGCWELILGKWYYFNAGGYAVTGWNEIDGTWYYMYEDGAMAAGTTTPDGYVVDGSGAWVQ